jgi:hypothetical protein
VSMENVDAALDAGAQSMKRITTLSGTGSECIGELVKYISAVSSGLEGAEITLRQVTSLKDTRTTRSSLREANDEAIVTEANIALAYLDPAGNIVAPKDIANALQVVSEKTAKTQKDFETGVSAVSISIPDELSKIRAKLNDLINKLSFTGGEAIEQGILSEMTQQRIEERRTDK